MLFGLFDEVFRPGTDLGCLALRREILAGFSGARATSALLCHSSDAASGIYGLAIPHHFAPAARRFDAPLL